MGNVAIIRNFNSILFMTNLQIDNIRFWFDLAAAVAISLIVIVAIMYAVLI
jgi:hypothetical protein